MRQNCTVISLGGENSYDVSPHCLPITIQSTHDISVHGLVYTDTGSMTGGFLAFPHAILGGEYVIDTYASDEAYAKIFITPVEDETTITIKPINESVRFQYSNGTNSETSFLLNSGEYVAMKSQIDSENIIGTRISSNYKISVVVSSSKVLIPSNASNGYDFGFILEQLLPTSSWGYRHVIPPFPGTNGWMVHIMSIFSNTTISLAGNCGGSQGNASVSAEGYDISSGTDASSSVCVIVANEPIQVVQFMKSSPKGGPEKGDPSMVLIPPVSVFHGNTTFSVSISDDIIQYISVIVRDTGKSGIMLNGNKLADGDNWECFEVSVSFYETSVTTFCYYSTILENGIYTLSQSLDSAKFSLSLFTYREKVLHSDQGSVGAAMLGDISSLPGN